VGGGKSWKGRKNREARNGAIGRLINGGVPTKNDKVVTFPAFDAIDWGATKKERTVCKGGGQERGKSSEPTGALASKRGSLTR